MFFFPHLALKSYSTVQPGWASATAKEVKAEDQVKKVNRDSSKPNCFNLFRDSTKPSPEPMVTYH